MVTLMLFALSQTVARCYWLVSYLIHFIGFQDLRSWWESKQQPWACLRCAGGTEFEYKADVNSHHTKLSSSSLLYQAKPTITINVATFVIGVFLQNFVFVLWGHVFSGILKNLHRKSKYKFVTIDYCYWWRCKTTAQIYLTALTPV